jgi:YidC/Oxa1 family membrane protein insertase
MEGQGKRLLLAVALALVVMLAWQGLFGKKPDDEPPPKHVGSGALVGSNGTQPGTNAVKAPGPTVACVDDKPIVLPYEKFIATFSRCGGVLQSWQLTDTRYERDATKGELLPNRPNAGAFAVDFASSNHVVDRGRKWEAKHLERGIEFRYEDDYLEIKKTFDIVPDAYIVRASISVKVKTDGTQRLVMSVFAMQDPKKASGGSSRIAARVWESASNVDGSIHTTDIETLAKEGPRFEKNVRWAGYEHPYLLAGYAPKPQQGVEVEKHTYLEGNEGMMRTDLVYSARSKAGTFVEEVAGYLGPKNYDQLENANTVAGFDTGFKDTIDLGWFGFIGRPLLWLLLKFYSLVGNWGIAIVLLTVLVKLATLYFTTKSMRSMKAMAALAPQMKLLQEKYKDDRQRLQVETMGLYKQHGVNPVAGCLPILLQMPIWIALYRMLSNAGELYLQPFIPGWIDDLTTSDPFYVLPIVLVVTMFVQARLTPQSVDSKQQKFLQYGMPLMFGAMSFFFPAGLTLYIFTNTVLSALHSIYMNKFDKKSLASMALLKKNQAVASAKADAAKSAKPVIDVKATEVDDEDDASEDEPAVAQTAAGAARGRRRKKRRR